MRTVLRLVMGGIAGLWLLGSAGAQEAATSQPKPPTFLFLGDSITRDGKYVRAIGEPMAEAEPVETLSAGGQPRPHSETLSNLSEPTTRAAGRACSTGSTMNSRK